ncbi:MAG: polysaccharide biosynthesis/export family protein [Pseudomonadota bacterium]|nr:polysaccharide biosynthesis/export family protein [Pseudomonadota bacterium]
MANQLLLKFKTFYPKVASSLFMTILLINGHALAENSVIDADVVIENQHQSNTVLGQNLFNGSFANQSFSGFNPNYRIAVGDKLLVQMWGAVESNGQQEVDTQGNIFLPQVGPINVLGILNSDLNKKVSTAISRIYKKDVFIYVNLVSSQPVRVFVTGNVINPGLYSGLSSESILAYLDRAGGVDPLRGSYLDVELKRNSTTLEKVNLYDFLFTGDLSHRQLYEGDVIVVNSRQHVISFSGLVENPFQIEFNSSEVSLDEAMAIVQPLPSATHLAIERNQGLIKQVEYIEIAKALDNDIHLMSGDSVNVVSDKIQGSIAVQVQGEHLGQSQHVLAYGAKLSDLLPLIEKSDQSQLSAVQLYRPSLAKKQRETMLTTLEILQAQVLSARSETVEEANLRSSEANLILQFIERAKKVSPKGQVILDDSLAIGDVTLENGDVVVVPKVSQLVHISGEVLFPNAVIYQASLVPDEYVALAGGYSQNAKQSRIILKKANGSSIKIKDRSGLLHDAGWSIEAGDELMVLPDVDVKSLQHAKDVFQIIYQLALSAGVVLKI